MSAVELGQPAGIEAVLRRCLDGGLRISAVAGQLRVQSGAERPDPALLALLREHKAALLALLEAHAQQPDAAIARRPPAQRARLPASPAQRRMVLLDQLDAQASRYNMVGAFMLRGQFDWAALQAAMQDVIARHEALRSRFDSAGGQVWQIVEAAPAPAWEYIDIASRPAPEQQRLLHERLQQENQWRFDLAAGALLRLTLLRMGESKAALIVNVHHIVCDGGSVDIIKREWAECYAARCAGTVAPAPGTLLQYGDYSQWLQQQEPRWRAQLGYWLTQLDGAPHMHSLPLDHARAPRQGHAGSKLHRALPADALDGIRRQCQAHGVTLFMHLHAAFAAVLSLYANEADIVTGTPVAGRRHRDAEATVGLFVNTLALRSRVDGRASFAQLLAANRSMILQALEHQDVPFDELVEQLDMPRSRAFSPLVQILFVLQTQLGSPLNLAGCEVDSISNDSEPVKVELQVVAQERDGQLLLEWHFSTALFAPASVARMADTLVRLLAVLDTHMDTPLFALPLAGQQSGQEPSQEPHGATTQAAPLLRLEHMFEAAAARFPERLALSGADASLSYGELDRQASALAGRLCAWGVRRSSVVALHLDRSAAMIVAMLAVLKAGAAYLPLDPVHPQARLQAILDDSGARVLLTLRARAEALSMARGRVVLLDDEAALAGAAQAVPARATHLAGDPAYILYTSGTTGQPKGVVVAHAGVANLMQHMDALAPLDAAPSGLLWSNMCFDVSVYETFSMLCSGGALYVVPEALRLEPQRLFQWMDGAGIASAFLHAAYLAPYAAHAAGGGGRALRRMLVGVEPIAAGPVEAVVRALPGLRVINGYGPTETTICCTLFPYGRAALAADAALPIGRAVQGLELRVMNAAGHMVPPGAIGELYVAGVGLALGYLNLPDLDSERFVTAGPAPVRAYRTSDLVRLNGDDELVFLGRTDKQVKVRGFRVELGEIETRLCQLDGVAEAVVVAAGDAAQRQLLAYVVLDDAPLKDAAAAPAAAFEQHVRRGLRKLLPEYMVPARVLVIERMPLNASGKVQLERLPAPEAGGAAPLAPRNDIEARLLRLWEKVLEVDGLSVTDDFFAVGGQSLLAMLLVARIREEFCLGDTAISVADLLDDPTIESFARTHAPVLAEESVRRKIHYLASLQDPIEEGVF